MVVANIVAAAHSRREAVLDFYNLSARSKADLALGRQQNRVAIEPVVRVHLRSALMGTILKGLSRAIAEVKLDDQV